MLTRINAALTSLSPAEQRVGQLVLSDPRGFARLPVAELAEQAHVSKPTVLRFCRSLGYDGLKDFKFKLEGSMSEGVLFVHRSVDVDDKINDIVVKVIDDTIGIGELRPGLRQMQSCLLERRVLGSSQPA